MFEAMKANLEAIASQTGHDVFRLRGVDIHRALRCAPTRQSVLDDFTRRLASATE